MEREEEKEEEEEEVASRREKERRRLVHLTYSSVRTAAMSNERYYYQVPSTSINWPVQLEGIDVK